MLGGKNLSISEKGGVTHSDRNAGSVVLIQGSGASSKTGFRVVNEGYNLPCHGWSGGWLSRENCE